MGLAQVIKAHYNDKNRPRFSRQIVLPAVNPGLGQTLTASGDAVCTYGAWEDIATTGQIGVDTIIVGVVLDTPVAAAEVLPAIFTVDIGLTYILATRTNYIDATEINTKVGLAVITDAQVHRAEVRVEVVSDAGPIEPIMLPFPIWVLSGVGVLGRVKTDTAGGEEDTINCSILCVQHFERAWE